MAFRSWCRCLDAPARTHAHILTYAHTHTCTHAQAHTHVHKHTYSHVRAHTHSDTEITQAARRREQRCHAIIATREAHILESLFPTVSTKQRRYRECFSECWNSDATSSFRRERHRFSKVCALVYLLYKHSIFTHYIFYFNIVYLLYSFSIYTDFSDSVP